MKTLGVLAIWALSPGVWPGPAHWGDRALDWPGVAQPTEVGFPPAVQHTSHGYLTLSQAPTAHMRGHRPPRPAETEVALSIEGGGACVDKAPS